MRGLVDRTGKTLCTSFFYEIKNLDPGYISTLLQRVPIIIELKLYYEV